MCVCVCVCVLAQNTFLTDTRIISARIEEAAAHTAVHPPADSTPKGANWCLTVLLAVRQWTSAPASAGGTDRVSCHKEAQTDRQMFGFFTH